MLFRLSLMPMVILMTTVQAQQLCRESIPSSAPLTNFTINSDGTVLHKTTGLIWKRCVQGQVGTTCSGLPTQLSWQEALMSADEEGFAEQTDWRLPNIQELRTLVEIRCSNPAINIAVFPNTPTGSNISFWSSTNSLGQSFAWGLSFSRGTDLTSEKLSRKFVRLVRGPDSSSLQ